MARGFAPEEAEAAFAKGQRQLEVVRRQAAISQLYPHQVSYDNNQQSLVYCCCTEIFART